MSASIASGTIAFDAGAPACSGWSVGKPQPILRSVITLALSASASATRLFQCSTLREARPAKIIGCLDALSIAAALRMYSAGAVLGAVRHVAGGVERRQRRRQRRLLQARVEVDVDRPLGRRFAIQPARTIASRAAAAMPAGRPTWCSCGRSRPGRARCGSNRSTAGAWLRRRARSRPCTSSGMRSHQALNIAMVACIRPDIGVHGRGHRLAGHLGIAVRDRDRILLVQAEQHLRRLIAEVVDEAVVQSAEARAGIERDVGDCSARSVSAIASLPKPRGVAPATLAGRSSARIDGWAALAGFAAAAAAWPFALVTGGSLGSGAVKAP